MNRLITCLGIALMVCPAAIAQQSLAAVDVPFPQTFNSIGSSATATLPAGWRVGSDWSSGTTNTTISAGTSGVGAASAATSSGLTGAINWGEGIAASSTNRWIGFRATNATQQPRSILHQFVNDSGKTLTSLELSWTFKKAISGETATTWAFFHGPGDLATNLVEVFGHGYVADATASVLSLPAQAVARSVRLNGLNIPNGSKYLLRWTYQGSGTASGAYQGLGLDDFSITARTVGFDLQPQGRDQALVAAKGATREFPEPDWGFGDPSQSPPNRFAGFRILQLPKSGRLSVGGVDALQGQLVLKDRHTNWQARLGDQNRMWSSVASSADGRTLAAVDSNLGLIHVSQDFGATWVPRESARAWQSISCSGDGSRLAAVVAGGRVHTSADAGATWTAQGSVQAWQAIASSADGLRLVAVAYGGRIYTSGDAGVTWTACESARNWFSVASSRDGTRLAAVVQGGSIYVSNDSGQTWTARASQRNWWSVAMSSDASRIAAVADDSLIYVSSDGGATWTPRDEARPWRSIAVSDDGTRLAAVAWGGQVWFSRDSGETWSASEQARSWRAIAMDSRGTRLAGAVFNGQVHVSEGFFPPVTYTAPSVGSTDLFSVSVQDNGLMNQSAPASTVSVTVPSASPVGADKDLTLAPGSTYVFQESDWGFGDPGDDPPNRFTGLRFTALPTSGNVRVDGVNAVANQVILRDKRGTWNGDSTRPPELWRCIASSADGAKLVAVSEGAIYTDKSWFGGIRTSSDFGATWKDRTVGSTGAGWVSVASSSDGTKLAAVERYGLIHTSEDSGETWVARETAGSRRWSHATASVDGSKLAAVVDGGFIYTSADSGLTWVERGNSGSRAWSSVASSADGTKLAAVVFDGFLYTSTDSGLTWVEQGGSGSRRWRSVVSSSDGSKLAAVVDSGFVYTSTDSGRTWVERTAAARRSWMSIATSTDGTRLAAAVYGGSIFTSTDSGETWRQEAGAPSSYWFSIASSADGTRLAGAPRAGNIYTAAGVFPRITFDAGPGASVTSLSFQVLDDGVGSNEDPTPNNVMLRVNTAPTLGGATNALLDELVGYTQPLLPTDPDLPLQPLAVSLDSGPDGLVVTNGVLAWTPTERQGPSTNEVRVRVTDGVATVTNAFRLVVLEVNASPTLGGARDALVRGLGGYVQDLLPRDMDLPAQPLTVSLVSGPDGLVVTNGVLAWTPQAWHRPSTQAVRVAVSDGMTNVTYEFQLVVPKVAVPDVAPLGADKTLWVPQDGILTLNESDWGFLDPQDPPNTFAGFRIDELPATGTLRVGGSVAVTNQVVLRDRHTEWKARTLGTADTRSWQYVSLGSSHDGTRLAAAAWGDSIYISSDAGTSWRPGTGAPVANWNGIASSADGTLMAAVANQGPIFISRDSGVTWTRCSGAPELYWNGIAASADGMRWAAVAHGPDCEDSHLYTSDDSGVTWMRRTIPCDSFVEVSSSADGMRLAVVAYNGGIYTSSDAGATWTRCPTAPRLLWTSIASSADGMRLVAVSWGQGTYTSSDGGATWAERTSAGMPYSLSVASSADGTRLAFVSKQDPIRISGDGGATWTTATNLDWNHGWRAVASSADGHRLVAASGVGEMPPEFLGSRAVLYTSEASFPEVRYDAEGSRGGTVQLTFRVRDDGIENNEDLVPNALTLRVNHRPTLAGATNAIIDELVGHTQELVAADVDVPLQPLTVSLVSGPAGLVVTNGVLAWTPQEWQAPSTGHVRVLVSDGMAQVAYDFDLVVREVNQRPPFISNTDVTRDGELVFQEGSEGRVVLEPFDGDDGLACEVLLVSGPPGLELVNGPTGWGYDWDEDGVFEVWFPYRPGTVELVWAPTEAQGPSTNRVVMTVSDGSFTVTNAFHVVVLEVNDPPTLAGATNAVIPELARHVQELVPMDADVPEQLLTVSLVSGPAGLVVTNGVLAWTPTEAQGPSTNEVLVSVGDGVATVTNALVLVVGEVNALPTLAGATNAVIPELAGHVQELVPMDADVPEQLLTVSLVSGPAGLVVTNGVLAWTPTEAQGPSTNEVLVSVGDGVATVTNALVLVVGEVNALPTLAGVPAQWLVDWRPLELALVAMDEDVPSQRLSFRLVDGPRGMSVTTAGLLSWSPAIAQEATTNLVRFAVTDGEASLTNEFVVTVLARVPPTLTLGRDETGLFLRWTTAAGFRVEQARDMSAPAWTPFTGIVTEEDGTITLRLDGDRVEAWYRLMRDDGDGSP